MFGVSKDDAAAQAKFKEKHGLPFPLLCDVDAKVMKAYGVWKEKTLYGKKFMGCERTTFLVGADGRIERVWPKVKVDGHASDVLGAL